MPGPAKRSGLQQQVLNLYRACFRAARQKPAVGQTIVLFLQGLLLMLVTLCLGKPATVLRLYSPRVSSPSYP